MKVITIILLFLFILPVKTEAKTLLSCLGKEELKIYMTNDNWYNYKLNQNLINIISSGDAIKFSKRELNQICNSKTPSVQLLYDLLKFIINKRNVSLKANKYFLNIIQTQTISIFFTYLSNLQSMAPTPNCLKRKIPTLAVIQNKFQYLEGDISSKNLLTNKDVDEIFTSLSYVGQYFQECTNEKINGLNQNLHN